MVSVSREGKSQGMIIEGTKEEYLFVLEKKLIIICYLPYDVIITSIVY